MASRPRRAWRPRKACAQGRAVVSCETWRSRPAKGGAACPRPLVATGRAAVHYRHVIHTLAGLPPALVVSLPSPVGVVLRITNPLTTFRPPPSILRSRHRINIYLFAPFARAGVLDTPPPRVRPWLPAALRSHPGPGHCCIQQATLDPRRRDASVIASRRCSLTLPHPFHLSSRSLLFFFFPVYCLRPPILVLLSMLFPRSCAITPFALSATIHPLDVSSARKPV